MSFCCFDDISHEESRGKKLVKGVKNFNSLHMNLQFHCDEKLSRNLYNLRNCLNMKSSHVDSKNLAGNGFFKNLDFFENFLPTCPISFRAIVASFKFFK